MRCAITDIYLNVNISQMLHARMQMNHSRMMTEIAKISSYLVVHLVIVHTVNVIILIPIYVSLQRQIQHLIKQIKHFT